MHCPDTAALEKLVLSLGELLQKRHYKITTAESCTGGLIAETITNVPGSSTYFECGFVTYSNDAKQRLLRVPQNIIDQFGAVSEETVRAMALGALKYSRADVSIAVTGIAGPSGGTPDKPVGTVWLGWGMENEIVSELFQFAGDRLSVRNQSVYYGLQRLMGYLQKI